MLLHPGCVSDTWRAFRTPGPWPLCQWFWFSWSGIRPGQLELQKHPRWFWCAAQFKNHWPNAPTSFSYCLIIWLHCVPIYLFFGHLKTKACSYPRIFAISNSFCLECSSYRSVPGGLLVIQAWAPRALLQARLFLIPCLKLSCPQHYHIILFYFYYGIFFTWDIITFIC